VHTWTRPRHTRGARLEHRQQAGPHGAECGTSQRQEDASLTRQGAPRRVRQRAHPPAGSPSALHSSVSDVAHTHTESSRARTARAEEAAAGDARRGGDLGPVHAGVHHRQWWCVRRGSKFGRGRVRWLVGPALSEDSGAYPPVTLLRTSPRSRSTKRWRNASNFCRTQSPSWPTPRSHFSGLHTRVLTRPKAIDAGLLARAAHPVSRGQGPHPHGGRRRPSRCQHQRTCAVCSAVWFTAVRFAAVWLCTGPGSLGLARLLCANPSAPSHNHSTHSSCRSLP
jgi:hypothetical protein